MDLSDLHVFLAVARSGGITRAAAELHTVQSGVSARVAGLEKELRAPLFRRHARGVALTAAGEKFLGYAQRITALAEEARHVLSDETPSGPLRIGAMETTAGIRLPPVLQSFMRAWPDVDLSLTTGPTDDLVASVTAHELDAALVAAPVDDVDLREEPVYSEELVLVTARRYRLLEEALRVRGGPRLLVFRSGCSYRRRLEAAVRARGAVPDKVLEYGTVEGILGCVGADLGITMLPRSLVERFGPRDGLRVHRPAPAEATAVTVLVYRADTHVSAALAEFRHHLGLVPGADDLPAPVPRDQERLPARG